LSLNLGLDTGFAIPQIRISRPADLKMSSPRLSLRPVPSLCRDSTRYWEILCGVPAVLLIGSPQKAF
jgi:hypothetical protein